MMHNSYGFLCFSILARSSTNCSKLFKVSSLLHIGRLQKQILPASALKSTFSSPVLLSKGTRSSNIFHSSNLSTVLSVPGSGCTVAFPGGLAKFLAMNPAKRPMDGGSSPPHKYRLLHCNATETDADSLESPSMSKIVAASSSEDCGNEENTISPAKVSNDGKKKLNTAKKIRYEKLKARRAQVKQSLVEYDALVQEKGLLEEMNSKETTFGAKERVISDAVTPAANWNIDPKPIDAEESELSDGMLNPKKKKKMFAVMLSYSGKGFLGLQNNPPHRTIEGELLKAMQSKELLTETECLRLQVVNFQRAARTDKGVSAAKQVISVRLPIADGQEEKVKEDLNALLLPQIRIMDIRRATRSFNSKNWCDCRTYSYLAPSFAFAPLDQVTSAEFRISEAGLAELRSLMAKYVGTRNFHNFTIRKKPTDANAKRFVQLVEVDDPFVREGVEWILFKIRGQSFMMHQIRKMLGLVMSICRGLMPLSVLDESFTHAKIETPKAPGLGLVLEQPHYDIYNKRFGRDGTHKPIDWAGLEDKVEAFRRDYIDQDIITTELREHSMLEFLKLLHMYSFTDSAPGPGIRRAHNLVTGFDLANEDLEDDQLLAENDDEDDTRMAPGRAENSVSSAAESASRASKDASSVKVAMNGHRDGVGDSTSGELAVPAPSAVECRGDAAERVAVSHRSAGVEVSASDNSACTEVDAADNSAGTKVDAADEVSASDNSADIKVDAGDTEVNAADSDVNASNDSAGTDGNAHTVTNLEATVR